MTASARPYRLLLTTWQDFGAGSIQSVQYLAQGLRARGLPAEGVIGRIGVSVSPADPNRVYAIVEHASGGLFRSDDAGASWSLVNSDRNIRQRAFYYTHVTADPKNADHDYQQIPYTATDDSNPILHIEPRPRRLLPLNHVPTKTSTAISHIYRHIHTLSPINTDPIVLSISDVRRTQKNI